MGKIGDRLIPHRFANRPVTRASVIVTRFLFDPPPRGQSLPVVAGDCPVGSRQTSSRVPTRRALFRWSNEPDEHTPDPRIRATRRRLPRRRELFPEINPRFEKRSQTPNCLLRFAKNSRTLSRLYDLSRCSLAVVLKGTTKAGKFEELPEPGSRKLRF